MSAAEIRRMSAVAQGQMPAVGIECRCLRLRQETCLLLGQDIYMSAAEIRNMCF